MAIHNPSEGTYVARAPAMFMPERVLGGMKHIKTSQQSKEKVRRTTTFGTKKTANHNFSASGALPGAFDETNAARVPENVTQEMQCKNASKRDSDQKSQKVKI